jgi:hypothetical protein
MIALGIGELPVTIVTNDALLELCECDYTYSEIIE